MDRIDRINHDDSEQVFTYMFTVETQTAVEAFFIDSTILTGLLSEASSQSSIA